jgi:tetratricopeptide (TPR) repeat protein
MRSAPSVRSAPSMRSAPSINRSAPNIGRSAPSINRSAPSINRSSPGINRVSPNIGGSRPQIGSGSRPQVGGTSRPQIGGNSSRPQIGGNSTRAQIGSGSRPQIGSGSRPQIGGNSSRPQIGANSSRPQIGSGSRPQIGSGSRPQIGGQSPRSQAGADSSRPQIGDRSSRPQIGGQSPRSQAGADSSRPQIGDRSSRPQIGGDSPRSQIGSGARERLQGRGGDGPRLGGATDGTGRGGLQDRLGSSRLGGRDGGEGVQSLRERSGLGRLGDQRSGLLDRSDRAAGLNSRRGLEGRRSGDFANLNTVNTLNHRGGNFRGGDWGRRNWSGRYFNRHNRWHRGFAVNLFVNSPWGWSPWWGGFGGPFGFGGWGWGPNWGFGIGMGWGGGWGLGGWGWNDWWGPWGYAPLAFHTGYWNYYNPYCYQPLVLGSTVIDYSQPVIFSEAAIDSTVSTQAEADDPKLAAAMAEFDVGREAFARGNYQAALESTHRALEHLPSDAALHEFLALVHFAMGNYRDAAGVIHSVLAVGPGWSWETMHGLYGNVDVYTRHLRAAEAYRRTNPEAPYVRFLLAYHYMTTGHGDAAATQLRHVMRLEPSDSVAAQLLEGLTGERVRVASSGESGAATGTADASRPQPPPLPTSRDEPGTHVVGKPETGGMVGTWSASREDGSKFQLELTEDARFTWSFSHKDQSSELTGKYTLSDDLLVLEPDEGGAMIGRVGTTGDKQFQFRLLGSPEDDPGLTFQK